jgi:hypothetical protein
MASRQRLKRDALGAIERWPTPAGPVTVRLPSLARTGLGRLATRLARRETRALARLAGIDGVPEPLRHEAEPFARTWIDGEPLHRARPPDLAWFRDARRLLHRLHRAGVTHNDLAKEANWLRRADGRCGVVDFQIAMIFTRRSRWFRLLAREDLRHLLKHKRHYLPGALTARERGLLANPALPARLWRRAVKPFYRLVTRGLLRWPERAGAEERGALPATGRTRIRTGGRV